MWSADNTLRRVSLFKKLWLGEYIFIQSTLLLSNLRSLQCSVDNIQYQCHLWFAPGFNCLQYPPYVVETAHAIPMSLMIYPWFQLFAISSLCVWDCSRNMNVTCDMHLVSTACNIFFAWLRRLMYGKCVSRGFESWFGLWV